MPPSRATQPLMIGMQTKSKIPPWSPGDGDYSVLDSNIHDAGMRWLPGCGGGAQVPCGLEELKLFTSVVY